MTLFLTSLVSCSNNAITEQAEKSPIITETTTAELTTQEIEIPPATERETITESITELLYEDENITIFYNGYESLATAQRVYLTIENKSEKELNCGFVDFKANEIPIDVNNNPRIKPLNSISYSMDISNSAFQKVNITRVNKMEFMMHIQLGPIFEQITKSDGRIEKTTTFENYDTDIITIER